MAETRAQDGQQKDWLCPADNRAQVARRQETARLYLALGLLRQARFNPLEDLRRNSFGVLEFDGNKPELEREFDRYLRSRQEDANIIL